MEILEDVIAKHFGDKYLSLKFLEIVYSQPQNTCTISFLYPENLSSKFLQKDKDAINNYDTAKIILFTATCAAMWTGIFNSVQEIVKEKQITTVMVTHNLRYAVNYGNRLIMMDKGNIVLDKKGEEKEELDIDYLLKIFNSISIECGN